MNNKTTIICLSVISIIACFTDNFGGAILLWAGYGFYKMMTNE